MFTVYCDDRFISIWTRQHFKKYWFTTIIMFSSAIILSCTFLDLYIFLIIHLHKNVFSITFNWSSLFCRSLSPPFTPLTDPAPEHEAGSKCSVWSGLCSLLFWVFGALLLVMSPLCSDLLQLRFSPPPPAVPSSQLHSGCLDPGGGASGSLLISV